MLSVWCLVPGNYPTARRLRPLRSLIEDRTIAEKSIDLILSRYLSLSVGLQPEMWISRKDGKFCGASLQPGRVSAASMVSFLGYLQAYLQNFVLGQ